MPLYSEITIAVLAPTLTFLYEHFSTYAT